MIEVAFVTPHAVRQFQDRIAKLAYEKALTEIIHELKKNIVKLRPSRNGVSFYVRVCGKKQGRYDFRAVIKTESEIPIVVTILRSGKKK